MTFTKEDDKLLNDFRHICEDMLLDVFEVLKKEKLTRNTMKAVASTYLSPKLVEALRNLILKVSQP